MEAVYTLLNIERGVPVVLVPFGYSDVDVRTLQADALCEAWAEIPTACARLLSPRLA